MLKFTEGKKEEKNKIYINPGIGIQIGCMSWSVG